MIATVGSMPAFPAVLFTLSDLGVVMGDQDVVIVFSAMLTASSMVSKGCALTMLNALSIRKRTKRIFFILLLHGHDRRAGFLFFVFSY